MCPDVPVYQRDYLECFFTLNNSRGSSAEGTGAIEYREIVAWLDENHIRGAERGEFILIVQAMDSAWRSAILERRQQS